jgi:pimeloyl-ACP methyl ester carboxylesterase
MSDREFEFVQVAVNGVELRVLQAGSGAVVVLCHGFPELAFSWRHQVGPLVEAGYRVLAPDMRGYGGSSCPHEVEAYDVLTVGDDLVGLLDAFGAGDAVFVGHDWGASVVWQLALTHPDRVRALVALSVPFVPRAPARPAEILRRRLGDDFYLVWFQQVGPADEALASDVRRTLTTTQELSPTWARQRGERPPRPSWLTEQELAVYVDAFTASGFTGGLNYYRNIDRNWLITEPYAGRVIDQPAMFVAGSDDVVGMFMPTSPMQEWVTDLRVNQVIDGAGHWLQQERPSEVNRLLLDFLSALPTAD